MPEIHIRPFQPSDLPALVSIDHRYTTDYVWQMEQQMDASQVKITFREARLPRTAQVDYPRPPLHLADRWHEYAVILVALKNHTPIGYAGVVRDHNPGYLRVTDMAVAVPSRHQGVARVLLFSAEEWAREQKATHLMLEMQSKNFPAISLALKTGYEFCGYNDRHYANRDIALFFGKPLT